jgi:hypothetical protein
MKLKETLKNIRGKTKTTFLRTSSIHRNRIIISGIVDKNLYKNYFNMFQNSEVFDYHYYHNHKLVLSCFRCEVERITDNPIDKSSEVTIYFSSFNFVS